jgi:DNA-binding CsgD family transcriptional regulator
MMIGMPSTPRHDRLIPYVSERDRRIAESYRKGEKTPAELALEHGVSRRMIWKITDRVRSVEAIERLKKTA